MNIKFDNVPTEKKETENKSNGVRENEKMKTKNGVRQ